MPNLRDFILGQVSHGFQGGMKAGSEGAGGALADKRAAALQAANPGSKVAVTSEGATIDPQEGLSDQLKVAQLQALQDERMNRRVERLSGAMDKSGIPQVEPAVAGVQKSFKGESVTPAMLAVPEGLRGMAVAAKASLGRSAQEAQNTGKKSLGSWLAKLSGVGPESSHANEEFQDLQRLLNIDVRQFAGAAQTKFEVARKMVEQGMQAGGNPEMVRRGTEMMREAALSRVKNLKAGAGPDASAEYEKRLGAPLEGSLTTPITMNKMSRLEELRKKAQEQ